MFASMDNGWKATAAATLAAAAVLATVFIAQYGFDLQPCSLCYMQRVPYFLVLVLGGLALMPAVDSRSRRIVMFHLFGIFVISAAAALYHAGVEMHWWQGPTACTGSVGTISLDDLTAALGKPSHPMCDQPAFVLMGISMAGYNFIASVAFAFMALGAAKRKHWWTTP